MKRTLTLCLLLILSVTAGLSPFIRPPAGLSRDTGLGTFQVAVAAAAGSLMLAVLLLTSVHAILWPEFVRPKSYPRGVRNSLLYCALSIGAEAILFVCIVLIGLPSFYTNTAPPLIALDLQEWLRGFMAFIAVTGAIAAVRACILIPQSVSPGRRGVLR